jgi:hypothetical protein
MGDAKRSAFVVSRSSRRHVFPDPTLAGAINAAARRFEVSPMKEMPVDEFRAAVSSVLPIPILPR